MSHHARRKNLSDLDQAWKASCHTGLWLDKWLEQAGSAEKRQTLIDKAIGCRPSSVYRAAFQRWLESFSQDGPYLKVKLRAQSRIAIGIGAQSVLETSLTLHKTYAMPILPGSALKGLCRRYCMTRYGGLGTDQEQDQMRRQFLPSPESSGEEQDQNNKQEPTYFDNLFGRHELAGGVIFHDAWFDPKSTKGQPLIRDVLTVHHRDYYSDSGKPPADWDDPNPVQFIDVAPETYFLAIIEGSDGWREMARDILTSALANEGIGAKTSSGYGRLTTA